MLSIATAALLYVGLSESAQADPRTFHVKITNLTSGQPMSPPLWAVHNTKVDVWSVGALASNGVRLIVEDAANTTLQAQLNANPAVTRAVTETGSPAGPILPSASREFDVSTDGDQKLLTMLWMLVRTNDGFTGLDGHKLAGEQGETRTLLLRAYDGGTENNNQSCAFIPGPPCGMFFARDATTEPIAPHPGITGGDIAAYAWTNPVAEVQITRTQ